MYPDSNPGSTLTVVEFGSLLPSPPSRAERAAAQATVVQQRDESPAELALRAVRRAQQLLKGGNPVRSGVIVASDRSDDEAFRARCQIAKAMLGAMPPAGPSRLIFSAPHGLSDEGRHELLAIAGTLATQLEGQPVEVLVRFDRPGVASAQGGEPGEFAGAA